jgi:hypothetical protein
VRGAREPRAARARLRPASAAPSISRAGSRAARCSRGSSRRHGRRGGARGRAGVHRARRGAVRGVGAACSRTCRRARRGVRAGAVVEPVASRGGALRAALPELERAARRGEQTTAPIAMRHTFPAAIAASQRTGQARALRASARTCSSPPRSTTRRSRSCAVRRVEYASFRDRMQLLTGPSLVKALEGSRGARHRGRRRRREGAREAAVCASSPRVAATR